MLCCDVNDLREKNDKAFRCHSGIFFKELLVEVACQLVDSDGALARRQGPLDAQSTFFNILFSFGYLTVDLSLQKRLVECISVLTLNYLSSTEKVRCRTLTDGNFNAATCFSAQPGSERKISKQSPFETLLCTLLKVAMLVLHTPLKIEPTVSIY